MPVGIGFSTLGTHFYEITDNGLLSVWDADAKKNMRLGAHEFRKKTKGMKLCRKSEKIIIAFEFELLMLTYREGNF